VIEQERAERQQAAREQPERRRRAEGASARRSERARRGLGDASSGGTRPRRPRRAAAGSGTGGAFGLPSTRRAALLAIVVCALMLSVAVPLRTYLSQRAEIADQRRQQQQLGDQLTQLLQRKEQLSDPAQVEAEARQRLGYVRPGETPYVVVLPSTTPSATPQAGGGTKAAKPWYERLWASFTGGGS
jgi:cell division protein FtsB